MIVIGAFYGSTTTTLVAEVKGLGSRSYSLPELLLPSTARRRRRSQRWQPSRPQRWQRGQKYVERPTIFDRTIGRPHTRHGSPARS